MTSHICPSCGQHLDGDSLIYPVPDVQDKVLPGESMPAGECPDCGALVNAVDSIDLTSMGEPEDEIDEE